jgi:hypothetical protein
MRMTPGLKRLAGLLAPLAVGGTVIAVHASAVTGTPNLAVTDPCATTTTAGGSTTTGSGSTTTASGATTTTVAGTTTTASGTTTTGGSTTTSTTTTLLPVTLTPSPSPSGTTTTTAGGTTTTASGATTTTASGATTTAGGSTTTSSGSTTTGGSTTTTACATTTTSSTSTTSSTPAITSVSTNHQSGSSITISGTAPAGSTVVLRTFDPRNGTANVASATADGTGHWTITLLNGVLYNSILEVKTGNQTSSFAQVLVRQLVHLGRARFTGHDRHGYHFTISGSTNSFIPREYIEVLRGTGIIGRVFLTSSKTFSINFTLPKAGTYRLAVFATGENASASNQQYTLPGAASFTVSH